MEGMTKIEKRPLTQSMNFAIPQETETLKNIEVDITFKNKASELKFHKNQTCFSIYDKYKTGSSIQGATAEMRRRTDQVYVNPLTTPPAPEDDPDFLEIL